MFEFRTLPPAADIMRHQAALTQRQTIASCTDLAARTGRTITVGGLTALQLLGVPLPSSCKLNPKLIDCIVHSHKTRFHLRGAVCHTWPNVSTAGAVIDVSNVECLSPEAVFAYMAPHLPLLELITLADSLTCRDEILQRTTLPKINAFIRDCSPFRGRVKCERALCLARERTDSPMESDARLIIAGESFPEMQTNYPIQTPGGEKLLDLASPEFRIAVEFDGSHHRFQISEDHERINDIQSQAWTVFIVDYDTLHSDIRRQRFLNALEQAFHNAGATFERRHLTLGELSDRRRHRNKKRSAPYSTIENPKVDFPSFGCYIPQ